MSETSKPTSVPFDVSATRRIAEQQRDHSGSVWDVLAYHLLWACDAFENERRRAVAAETRVIRSSKQERAQWGD